ncbi:MAG: DUF932 domain-containing protein [Steroidobacteraceae bacterium]
MTSRNANEIESLIDSTKAPTSAFEKPLSREDLQFNSPAALATAPDPRTRPTYAFLSTQQIVDALRDVGFVPFSAAQAASRRTSPQFARHVIRFRRRYETVMLRDCIPEIICLNGHDGRTSLQFRIALWRPICTNGLIVSEDTLAAWKIPHRRNLLDQAIAAVIAQSEQFAAIGQWVERMEQTELQEPQRLEFAQEALALRFPKDRHPRMPPARLLEARRTEDTGHDLWHVYNVVQENVIKGDLEGRTASNKPMRTRAIRSIQRDVALNTALWRMATTLAV